MFARFPQRIFYLVTGRQRKQGEVVLGEKVRIQQWDWTSVHNSLPASYTTWRLSSRIMLPSLSPLAEEKLGASLMQWKEREMQPHDSWKQTTRSKCIFGFCSFIHFYVKIINQSDSLSYSLSSLLHFRPSPRDVCHGGQGEGIMTGGFLFVCLVYVNEGGFAVSWGSLYVSILFHFLIRDSCLQ